MLVTRSLFVVLAIGLSSIPVLGQTSANGAIRGYVRDSTGAFYPMAGEPNGIQGLSESDDGTLLISRTGGIRRLADNHAELRYPFPPSLKRLRAPKLLRDRDGGLWIGSSGEGVAHIHQGITDVFAQPDGLSGDSVGTLFEDREGNIWVATSDGLDRFRDVAVAPFSTRQGLSNSNVASVLASADGSVWLGTFDGLTRWNDGKVTIYREASQSPQGGVASIFQDRLGRVWVSTFRGVSYLENDRFVHVSGLPGGITRAIVEGSQGLWIANDAFGLFRVSHGGRDIDQIPWAKLNHKDDPAGALAADPSNGGLWLGFRKGGIAYFADGRLRASYSAADGLGEGRVSALQLNRDGTLWVSTEGGLSRIKNGRVATLTGKNGLPCEAVQWVIEDDAHLFWLAMKCGLVRIAREEMEAWAAAVDTGGAANPRIQATVFDNADGVRFFVNPFHYSAPVAKSSDGRLWFVSQDGVSVVDPRRLPFNALPPPVHIEKIIADRKTYDVVSGEPVRLPALNRDLQIDYTALSLVAPEKMRFRYMLEGHDSEWQDVGTRRQAFYNDLPPRTYRFRVIASNNSGVWNEAGAALDFSVDPTYYQTAWFRVSSVFVFFGLLAAVHQLRLRHQARQFTMRLEERVGERTRIARDLHDTLLQSFQGVLLKFHAVTYLISERPDEAKRKLETVIEQAKQAIIEGRDAVQGLRSSSIATSDLARAIGTVGEALAAAEANDTAPDFRVQVEGTPRNLAPLLQDEVYRIAGEALRNAFRHAKARRIEVEICYDREQFRLRVRDDGKGIDATELGGARVGHYGLAGMNERARLVGGELAVWSKLDSGTETELTIPASTAYARSPAEHASPVAKTGV
jgi:signal transduction histidine kinase